MKNGMKTRRLLGAAVLFAAGGAMAQAQDYPSRTIEVVHQYGPGGGTDRFIRAVGEPFSEVTGAQIVPISVSGGGGIPAFTNFIQRPADGYSMLAISPDEIIVQVMGRIDMGELMPLVRVQQDQGLFMVPASSPYETIQDFIEHAKANPGDIKMGITGAAGFDDTAVGLWNLRTGAEVITIPFGSSEMVAATLGGQVDAMYEEYGSGRGLIDSGDLRPLVVFSEERLPDLPDVPTALELGYDITLGRWRGLAMHAGDDPAHAITALEAIKQATQSESYKKFESDSALQYGSVILGPEEFQTFIDSEIALYTDVLKQLGYIE
jgi:putative tricarboxylic transport membrane protein